MATASTATPRPTVPPGVTATAVTRAKGAELQHWINQANQERGRKTGRVDELRKRLAEHYGLKLELKPAEEAPRRGAPLTPASSGLAKPGIDANIQHHQWEHLVALGDEWEAAGGLFHLCQLPPEPGELSPPPTCCLPLLSAIASITSLHPGGLPLTTWMMGTKDEPQAVGFSPKSCGPETIHALLLAAQSGDQDALAKLQLSRTTTSTTPVGESQPRVQDDHLLSAPTCPPAPSTSASDAAILASSKMDLEALERAANLIDVIDQLERGDVKHMREKYGPQPGRPSNPFWAKIKVTICRCERLHHRLTDPKEFNGNKQHFLDFFASAPSQRGWEGEPHYPPVHLLAEAIPHRDHDITEEKAKPKYQGEDGNFSEAAWDGAWNGANGWEIWRMLGKEHY
ncbi:hypothetical protein F5887DRAFT_875801 [Amanita rubescens]|nr:hypothetical protein F5887DRAFT_875801 [Amanita rubescens]